MGEKLKYVCSNLAEAKDNFNLCNSCGMVYRKTKKTCPNCGDIKTKEVQRDDMDCQIAK